MVVARDDGLVETRKVPPRPTITAAASRRRWRGLVAEYDTTPDRIVGIVHATTVATNAILEYKGARTGLLTTRASATC